MSLQNSLWKIIEQTDFITQIVLVVMLGMSFLCWSFFFYKLMMISFKSKSVKRAHRILNNINSIEDLAIKSSMLQNTFAGDLISRYIADFKMLVKVDSINKYYISEIDWVDLKSNIENTLYEYIEKEESTISILSTSAQAGPLIGLFGTVWGLIHAFLAIGESKGADISVVAPGIAEALITTLGGLVVAIPSLVMFNYILAKIKKFEGQVLVLTEKVLWSMRKMLSVSTVKVNQDFKENFGSDIYKGLR